MLTKVEIDAIVRLGLSALLLTALVRAVPISSAQSAQTSVCGGRVFDHTHPYAMSYGGLWNYVREYENPSVPAELQHELSGDHISIGISFDERGRPGFCSDLSVRKDSRQKAISVSQSVKEKATVALCSSIRTWKFRPFLYCGKAAPVIGPLVFIAQEQRFMLVEVTDPAWRTGPAPVERKSNQ